MAQLTGGGGLFDRHRRQIEYVPIDTIEADPEPDREHSLAQIKQIAKSIQSFGFGSPLLIDANRKVIVGNGRLAALKYVGATVAPIIQMAHLSPEQARALAIADNRLTENSRFNERQLALHLKALAQVDLSFDLEATGFFMAEIDLKIEGLGALDPGKPDPDDELPQPGPAVCKPGDVWLLGEHRIVCGSALDPAVYQALLGEDRVAAVFADAPYNVPIHGHVSGKGRRRHREFIQGAGEMTGPEFTTFLANATRLAAQYSTPGSVHFWTMDWAHIQHLLAAGAAAYGRLLNICVWVKNNGGMGSLYRSAHELITVFRHDG